MLLSAMSCAAVDWLWTVNSLLSSTRDGALAAGNRFPPPPPLPSAGLHEVQRSPDQLEVLLVVGRIRPVDLDPFPRGSRTDTAGLKRNDVTPRELQLGHGRDGQAQRQALAVDAGEHPVAY